MNSNNYNAHSNSNQYNRQSISHTSNHQQNHIPQSIPGSKFYSTPVGKNDLLKRKAKEKHDDEDSPAPDSTTEPPPRPAKQFQEGDDVFFHTDNGKHILGTVGQIHGQTCLILFGDGSQQWASFKRVKKLSCALNEDDDESTDREKSKTEQTTAPSIPTNQQTELTCVSCGAVRRVPSKKALTYSPHTSNQFSCRRCTNKSITGSSAINFNSVSIQGPFNKSVGQKLLSRHNSGAISVQDSSSANGPSRVVSKTACAMPLPAEQGPMNVCFHCEKRTVFNDRVHCNLCERACHLRCLALSPPPLEGDRFWDVMCSACGTQKGNEQSGKRLKVFSVRRNISSWSDVVHLILCCLACKSSGQRYFDLETAIMPFFDVYLERLHLPRLYKAANPEDRKMYLLTALTNAKLRFINGKEVKKKCSLWAVRNENLRGFHMGIQPQIGTSFPVTANNTIDRSNAIGNAHIVPASAATTRPIIFNKEITVIPKPPPNSSLAPHTHVAPLTLGKPGEIGKRLEKEQRNKVDSVASFITSLSETTLKISKNNGLTLTPLPDKTGSTKTSASICDSNNKSSNDRTTITSSKSPSGSSSSGSLSEAESSSFDSNSTSASESSNEDSEGSESKTAPTTSNVKKRMSSNNEKQFARRSTEGPTKRNLRVRPPSSSNSAKKKDGPSQAKKPKLEEPIVTSSPVVKDKQKILNSISQTTPIPIILSPISKSAHPVANKVSNTNSSPRVAQKTSATSPLASERVRKKLSSEMTEDEASEREEDKEMDTTESLSSSHQNSSMANSSTQSTQNISKFPRAAKNQNANGTTTSNSSNAPATQPAPQQPNSVEPPSSRLVKVATYTTGPGSQPKPISPVANNNNTSTVQKPNGRPGRPKAARNLQLAYKEKEKAAALHKSQLKEKRKMLRAVRGRGRPLVKVADRKAPGLVLANGFIDSLITTPSSYGYNELFLSGDEPSSNNVACTNLTLRDCAFFSSGYEIKCLPPAPQTNQEKLDARDKVAKYFLSELPLKAPAFWNSSSKSQTEKGNRILSRDLNDFDSYDVVAKKVDSDGSVKYMVEWKTGFESESSSESCEDDVKLNLANGLPVADFKNSILNDIKIKKENEKPNSKITEKATTTEVDVEKCRSSLEYFVNGLGLRRAQTGEIKTPTLIDLTDSS